MSYILLGSSGLEPPTSRLSGARSNQLSYEPTDSVRFQARILFSWTVMFSPGAFVCCILVRQPAAFTACPRSRLSGLPDWRWWDSNPWPPACRAGALPTELHPHMVFVALSYSFNEHQSSLTENWTTICTLCTPIRRPSCNAVCSSP